ncbi:hypothetical protein [Microbacterium sp. zg-YB36]|uniref:hypothetical protein n=1 Tax=Microbacterium sp. zg-YB36 TaxID=2969407 RepID=UPI00214CB51A|nr:hypothetical protein [Microbacterium sp. zg-YB36]MDL5351142.1 hypothetical protein [Microbacterium sp. zg-YB36]
MNGLPKLKPEEEPLVDQVRKANLAYQEARATAFIMAQRMAEEQVQGLLIERDKLAYKAYRAGISKRKIAIHGLSSQHTPKADTAILHGAQFFHEEEAKPVEPATSPNFALLGDTLTVTLHPADFKPYAIEEASQRSHSFTVADGNILPVDHEKEETWMHPVVQVVTAANGDWKQKALEYVEGQTA